MKNKITKNQNSLTEEAETRSALLETGGKQAPQEPVFDLRQQRMLQQVAEDFPSKLGHFHRAYGGSLRAAITAKCLECLWGETAGIRECKATACPLYAKRPYQEVSHV